MLDSCWRKFKQAAGFLGKHTPLINSLLSFDIETHRQAAIKFLTLWILSSLPVLCACLAASNLGGFSTPWGDTPNVIEAKVWGLQHAHFFHIIGINLGMVLILVALVSPVDRLADQLFFMHMVQHLLLLDLAPILVLLGLTRVILRPLTRRRPQRLITNSAAS